MKTKDVYELTNPQKSIWMTEQFYKGSCINTICGSAILNEKINFDVLLLAINTVAQKHDNLWLKFIVSDGSPKQYLSNRKDLDIPIIDVNSENEMCIEREKLTSVPFSLYDSLLFNFYVFRFSDSTGAFFLNVHHLLADAWTLALISNEIINIYASYIKGTFVPKDTVYSYLDYQSSESQYLTSPKFNKDESFWTEQFKSVPDIATIPSTTSYSSTTSSSANRKLFQISKEMVSCLSDFCEKHRISLYNFFMAIFGIYIGKISNHSDFVLGTPILNRTNFKEKSCPGMFISTVPVKIHLEEEDSFSDFVKGICDHSLQILRHQKYPYQYLLEKLRKDNPTIPNLYNILISYQITNAKDSGTDFDYRTEWSFNGNCADDMDIHLFDINHTGALHIAYDYQLAKYTEKDILIIHERIMTMIEQVLKQDSILIKDIKIMTEKEQQELLVSFNQTELAYDKTIPIIQYFEQQALSNPKRVALVFEHSIMTYQELNEKSNSLAYLLREKGIRNNAIVGILMPRSFEMMIAILAVLKSGASYIPIDPDYPSNRIAYMLEDSKTALLLSEKSIVTKNKLSINYIDINLENNELYTCHKDNLENISKPEDLSYLIYTSGSTGKPKGVMLTQQNLSNFYYAMLERVSYLADNKPHKIVSITTLSFDIFLFETLISLTRGLTLYITNYYEQKITSKLERLIHDNEIEIIQTTPSVMRFHLDNLSDSTNFSSLKFITLAGEQLPKSLVDSIKKVTSNCTIYNGYGPSETTIFSTYTNVTDLDTISIGKPISNTQIYILNKNLSLVPKGSLGEIFISGDGVGKGYLWKEDLTKEKFIMNPFQKDSILYRTGDLGLWQENGTILCKGRIDNQVKLHGLRIELGEIEEKINSFTNDHLLKSAVIIKNVKGKDSLAAFLTYPGKLDIAALKKHLLSSLPSYMIPNTYTFIDTMPLTPNGKIDRKQLLNYKINSALVSTEVSLPRNKTEELLVEVISRKLNADSFGIDSNIFDFGADSLTIINILTELFKSNLNLKVYDLYKYPTVRELYDNLLTHNQLKRDLDESRYVQLNTFVKSFSNDSNAQSVDTSYHVLMTGATGFLGAHMLADLLEHPTMIQKIYCIIRKKDNMNTKERFFNKIHFYFGNHYDSLIEKYVEIVESDMVAKNLGLSDNDYEKLAKKIDIVIHAAANVKHYGRYSDFEKVNITATKNIIEFCQIANAHMHHISTMTVSGNYLLEQTHKDLVFDETSFYENQNFDDNVYAKSKLIAETNVLEAMKNGLTATIYRVGDLTGRYSDGGFQQNISENSIYLRLKSIIEIGCIPNSIIENDLEFSPVDYAAKAILNIVWSTPNENRIFNIYNPKFLATKNLIHYMNSLCHPIDVIEPNEFTHIIKDLSSEQENQNKLLGIINDFTENNDLVYNYTIKQNNDITCQYLSSLGFEWPDLNVHYIEKLLAYMIKVKFIQK